MKLKDLRGLYYQEDAICCECGMYLHDYTGTGIGAIFVMDKNGKFYCSNCDSKFEDCDDRIFDADLYNDIDEEEDITND